MFCDNLFRVMTIIGAKYIIYIENNIFYDNDINIITKFCYLLNNMTPFMVTNLIGHMSVLMVTIMVTKSEELSKKLRAYMVTNWKG